MIVETLIGKGKSIALELAFIVEKNDRTAEVFSKFIAIANDRDKVFARSRVAVDFHFDLAIAVEKMGGPGVVHFGAFFYVDRSGPGGRCIAVIIVIRGVKADLVQSAIAIKIRGFFIETKTAVAEFPEIAVIGGRCAGQLAQGTESRREMKAVASFIDMDYRGCGILCIGRCRANEQNQ